MSQEEIVKQAKRLNVNPRKELSPRALREKVKAAKLFLHRIRFLADEVNAKCNQLIWDLRHCMVRYQYISFAVSTCVYLYYGCYTR